MTLDAPLPVDATPGSTVEIGGRSTSPRTTVRRCRSTPRASTSASRPHPARRSTSRPARIGSATTSRPSPCRPPGSVPWSSGFAARPATPTAAAARGCLLHGREGDGTRRSRPGRRARSGAPGQAVADPAAGPEPSTGGGRAGGRRDGAAGIDRRPYLAAAHRTGDPRRRRRRPDGAWTEAGCRGSEPTAVNPVAPAPPPPGPGR